MIISLFEIRDSFNILQIFVILNICQVGAQITQGCRDSSWYCIERDPSEIGKVGVKDASNRSITWTWNNNEGGWHIHYYHSFPYKKYDFLARYIFINTQRQLNVFFSSERGWSSNERIRLFNRKAWNITYNGDEFGFKPKMNGEYSFHIYTRGKHYNPFKSGNSGDSGNCPIAESNREGTNLWWLIRNSPEKCPIVLNREDFSSPMEWSWTTRSGKWKVNFKWDKYQGNFSCSIYYKNNQLMTDERLVTFRYDSKLLTLSYDSEPRLLPGEFTWKLFTQNEESWGFIISSSNDWYLKIYSRNIIVRPFDSKRGVINLLNA